MIKLVPVSHLRVMGKPPEGALRPAALSSTSVTKLIKGLSNDVAAAEVISALLCVLGGGGGMC